VLRSRCAAGSWQQADNRAAQLGLHCCVFSPDTAWLYRQPTATAAMPVDLQEREQDLAAREDQLEAWKAQFKAEAVRQVRLWERAAVAWSAGSARSSRMPYGSLPC